jgi:DNA-binding PadR family transcriptional regulator
MAPLDDLLPLPPHTFLLLLVLRKRSLHGYGIKKELLARSDGRIDLDPGGLYRLIARMEARGVVRAAQAPAAESTDPRRGGFYTLTAAGERLLATEAKRLSALMQSPEVKALLRTVNA